MLYFNNKSLRETMLKFGWKKSCVHSQSKAKTRAIFIAVHIFNARKSQAFFEFNFSSSFSFIQIQNHKLRIYRRENYCCFFECLPKKLEQMFLESIFSFHFHPTQLMLLIRFEEIFEAIWSVFFCFFIHNQTASIEVLRESCDWLLWGV